MTGNLASLLFWFVFFPH